MAERYPNTLNSSDAFDTRSGPAFFTIIVSPGAQFKPRLSSRSVMLKPTLAQQAVADALAQQATNKR